ncbi:MoxR family ATPase [Phragmitibacter flavus]|uniref:MoxR family ATPase n=1 Tax=Phragmitibacter flavus TaxID=2576071 RepID=A0A5R8KEK7_9BACT|nr:MoxR family ATPase [Phragmitibacter flavus]TLD70019.1 MoxR family ATPase [Phragmitibacter flavus]
MSTDTQAAEQFRHSYQKLRTELAKRIVGQEDTVEQVFIAMAAGGHALLEGVPGLAKTLLVKSFADALDLSYRRIQFTPDLMPADITGTEIIQEDEQTGRRKLVFMRGPIFSQIILADEINRTPPKTQAALLEAMQERSVTIGQETCMLPQPFFVLATQNPIEQEGTYPLPEAQKDRFLFLIKVGYPSRDAEREILARTTGAPTEDIKPVLSAADLQDAQALARRVPVPDHVTDFVLDLVRATRTTEPDVSSFVKQMVGWGAGPRASQHLILSSKVRALLQGRTHVTLDDIEALARPVMRHRIVPTFHAEAEGITVDHIVDHLLKTVKKPQVSKVL